jgi:hypothetical protein
VCLTTPQVHHGLAVVEHGEGRTDVGAVAEVAGQEIAKRCEAVDAVAVDGRHVRAGQRNA